MTMRVFTLQNALFIFVGLRLVVLIAETFERLRILFILSTIIVHSYFTSCIFAARTLDFAVKFRLVFRYETVVFTRYVLALLLVSLLRKFEAYLVYLSLIQSKNPRRFSFFQKFRHFTYMLLWFQLSSPVFPRELMTCAVVFQLCQRRQRRGSRGERAWERGWVEWNCSYPPLSNPHYKTHMSRVDVLFPCARRKYGGCEWKF